MINSYAVPFDGPLRQSLPITHTTHINATRTAAEMTLSNEATSLNDHSPSQPVHGNRQRTRSFNVTRAVPDDGLSARTGDSLHGTREYVNTALELSCFRPVRKLTRFGSMA
jgi:hypothetical protein